MAADNADNAEKSAKKVAAKGVKSLSLKS